jgi:polysaccharide biosynthesis protein VpsQ
MKRLNMSQSRLWTIVSLAVAAIFSLILWLAYRGELPAFVGQYDKLGHLSLYGLVTLCGHRVFNRRHIQLGGRLIALFPLAFTIFTIVEELNQARSPNRSLDAIDLIASGVGIVCGYAIAQIGADTKPRS